MIMSWQASKKWYNSFVPAGSDWAIAALEEANGRFEDFEAMVSINRLLGDWLDDHSDDVLDNYHFRGIAVWLVTLDQDQTRTASEK